ncbi:MAG TPA: ankyrin repeat domain-containing protein [Bacteroidales bacterium]|nr:hypothetical protein [Bacteroidales bacterium]HRC90106.1 ankyrin repeat domain-containing protein [Bacteroidales bacterium]
MPMIASTYLRKTITLMLFLCAFCRSMPQENEQEEGDTLKYENILRGPDVEFNLNYNLLTASAEGDVIGIEWLIRHGADVKTSTNEGATALHFATANDKPDAVRVLLENGADPDVLSNYSEAPLHIAAKNNYLEIAEILALYGANVNITDRFGATPLHYAAAYGYLEMVDMLLYYEAATYIKDKDGTTPLMAAIWAGHADIADLLIQNGANFSEKDKDGFTPFLIAAQNGDTLIMELLLKRFVNIYETNNYGYNALCLATKSNHIEAVKYLLKKGNSWISENTNSVNPYEVAITYGRKEIAKILEENNITAVSKNRIDHINFLPETKFCLHDYYTGVSISLKEISRNIGFIFGYDFKPAYSRVLMKVSDDIFYQYMDKSSLIYSGVFKDFAVTDNPLGGNWFFSISLAGGYFLGNKLKGTDIVPGNKLKIIPAAGMKWLKNNFSLQFNAEYYSLPFYRIGPIWIKAGIGYNMFFNQIRAPGKIIKWY